MVGSVMIPENVVVSWNKRVQQSSSYSHVGSMNLRRSTGLPEITYSALHAWICMFVYDYVCGKRVTHFMLLPKLPHFLSIVMQTLMNPGRMVHTPSSWGIWELPVRLLGSQYLQYLQGLLLLVSSCSSFCLERLLAYHLNLEHKLSISKIQ